MVLFKITERIQKIIDNIIVSTRLYNASHKFTKTLCCKGKVISAISWFGINCLSSGFASPFSRVKERKCQVKTRGVFDQVPRPTKKRRARLVRFPKRFYFQVRPVSWLELAQRLPLPPPAFPQKKLLLFLNLMAGSQAFLIVSCFNLILTQIFYRPASELPLC